MAALMRWGIIAIILILTVILSGYGIFANSYANKTRAEIANENSQLTGYAILWAKNKENYSAIFENSFKSCKIASGQEKNYVSPSNPLITSQAILLMNSRENDFEKLKSAFDFVSADISYKVYGEWRYPSEVLETKAGDCTDKSILLVSMLKNYGIESYVVTGKKVNDYSHAWVAAKIDGKWMQIDPTAGDLNFVYECLADESCAYHDNYEIESIFNERGVLKCGG